ncbi:hypothetical protein BJ912DRAFT_1028259 [Pholiota molesta]|nr:hypothetical protein BJ912DRAFT_1028259 [Pholiota molesta]
MNTEEKVPLPKFLKLLASNGVPMPKAIAIAGKVYKEYNTPAALTRLDDVTLSSLGVDSKEERKLAMTALKKAGYTSQGVTRKTILSPSAPKLSASAGPSVTNSHSPPRKRKRPDNSIGYLPEGPEDSEETANSTSFGFNEILDEEILKTKSAVINRAPVMMTWAMLVAERLHFSKEEALSIASVYTEMNAISKGVSLGIFDKGKIRDSDGQKGGSQPYVELMGRRSVLCQNALTECLFDSVVLYRIPLYHTQTGQWRALNNGKPVPPTEAFSYISRSFRQTAPHFVGALRLLAESYSPQELNNKAWSYMQNLDHRSTIHCKTILELRKQISESSQPELGSSEQGEPIITIAEELVSSTSEGEPKPKKTRSLTVEEYEASLDQDTTFDHVDLDFADGLTSPRVSPVNIEHVH